MKILLIIILLIAFIQSVLNLQIQEVNESKRKITRSLSILYVCGFIFGCAHIIIEENKNEMLDLLAITTLNKIESLDSIVNDQLNFVTLSVNKNQILLDRFNNLNRQTSEILEGQNQLIIGYKQINTRLKNQLQLEKLKFIADKPEIKILDCEDVKWDTTLNGRNLLKVSLRNIGNRNTAILGIQGSVKLFDKNDNLFGTLEFPSDSMYNLLEPYTNTSSVLVIRSNSFKENFGYVLKNTKTAIFKLTVKYLDIPENNEHETVFHRANTPSKEKCFSVANSKEIAMYETK
jgi:hypothetical protein